MGKLAQSYAPDHCRRLIPPRTPKARLAAELSLRVCTLREQYPGAHAQAPHQKDAQTEHWLRPHRLNDGMHANASKAYAAPTSKLKLKSSKLKLDLSHVLAACLGKTAFFEKLSFQQSQEMGSKKQLSASTVALTSMSSVDSFEKLVQNGQFPCERDMRSGKEITANCIVN